ncbi:MAG: ACP S-malonyltransferase [Myxococcota bacterium]|jgi:[acyl-carrier-protein] S-malonyltransferase|nr:ACP S-malonyltransferase [Myxococcota bacterium]
MTFAFVFPGQGAQKVGMGKELLECSPAAQRTFEEADEALGEPLSKLIAEGPAETLTMTANTQPAILTMSVAAHRAFSERFSESPAFVAGHSLGEYSALVAAGAMSFSDAVRITRARGTFMQQAVPVGVGAMAAIIGLEPDDIEKACIEAAQGEVVSPANFNSPGQIVISGHATAVKRAGDLLTASGAKVIPLQVSAPFHSALMAKAAQSLFARLEDVRFASPAMPVVTNVEAAPNSDASRIRELLTAQVTEPVRWTDSVNWMVAQGVTRFVELGPGNVLAGLIKKTSANAKVASVNAPTGLDKALELLKEQ